MDFEHVPLQIGMQPLTMITFNLQFHQIHRHDKRSGETLMEEAYGRPSILCLPEDTQYVLGITSDEWNSVVQSIFPGSAQYRRSSASTAMRPFAFRTLAYSVLELNSKRTDLFEGYIPALDLVFPVSTRHDRTTVNPDDIGLPRAGPAYSSKSERDLTIRHLKRHCIIPLHILAFFICIAHPNRAVPMRTFLKTIAKMHELSHSISLTYTMAQGLARADDGRFLLTNEDRALTTAIVKFEQIITAFMHWKQTDCDTIAQMQVQVNDLTHLTCKLTQIITQRQPPSSSSPPSLCSSYASTPSQIESLSDSDTLCLGDSQPLTLGSEESLDAFDTPFHITTKRTSRTRRQTSFTDEDSCSSNTSSHQQPDDVLERSANRQEQLDQIASFRLYWTKQSNSLPISHTRRQTSVTDEDGCSSNTSSDQQSDDVLERSANRQEQLDQIASFHLHWAKQRSSLPISYNPNAPLVRGNENANDAFV